MVDFVLFCLVCAEKNTYSGLPDFMTAVAEQELGQLDSSVTECSVIYLPQVLKCHTLGCLLICRYLWLKRCGHRVLVDKREKLDDRLPVY